MGENQKQIISLPASVRDAIVSHAREGKPEEICGVIRGRGLEAYESIRGRNLAEDRIDNYEVDPQTLLLQFEFEDNGEEMMGIYHSHPISVAYPSATDAWNAHYPDSIYFICSLEDDNAPVIRAYRMTPYFVDLNIVELRNALSFYETRPGLFAYYQESDQPLPPVLSDLPAGVTLPFYVVYYHSPETDDGEPDVRVVSLHEHPIAIA